MEYSKEMFDQTLKAAELSTVNFNEPIAFDERLLECGKKYLTTLLEEPSIISYCYGDPDRYYYMIATHALYAGFCIANWMAMGQIMDKSLEGVLAFDSIAVFRMNWSDVDSDDVDCYASDVYGMAIGDFQNKYNQEYIIDNNNKYIRGLLLAFFVIGYNLKPEYF